MEYIAVMVYIVGDNMEIITILLAILGWVCGTSALAIAIYTKAVTPSLVRQELERVQAELERKVGEQTQEIRDNVQEDVVSMLRMIEPSDSRPNPLDIASFNNWGN